MTVYSPNLGPSNSNPNPAHFLPPLTSSPPPQAPPYIPPREHAMAPDPIHIHGLMSPPSSGPSGAEGGMGSSAGGTARRDGSGLERSGSERERASDRGDRAERRERAERDKAFPSLSGAGHPRLPNGSGSGSHSRSGSLSGSGLVDAGYRDRARDGRDGDTQSQRGTDRRRDRTRSMREEWDGERSDRGDRDRERGDRGEGRDRDRGGDMEDGEVITTIFVVGFPDDMAEREFQNLFTFAPGFEAATLKLPSSASGPGSGSGSLSASISLPPPSAGGVPPGTGVGVAAGSALRQQQQAGAQALLAELQALAAQQAAAGEDGTGAAGTGGGLGQEGQARQAQLEEALAALQMSMAHPHVHPAYGYGYGVSASSSSSTTPSAAISMTPSAPSGPLSSLMGPGNLGLASLVPGAPGVPVQLSAPGRRQAIGFARFRTREHALSAKEHLQGRRVDGASGNTLKAEIAKKNLHTKRPLASGSGVPVSAVAGGAGPAGPGAGTGLMSASIASLASVEDPSGTIRRALSLSSNPGYVPSGGSVNGIYPLSPTSAPGFAQMQQQPQPQQQQQQLQQQQQQHHRQSDFPAHGQAYGQGQTQAQGAGQGGVPGAQGPGSQSAKEAWDSWSDTHLSPPSGPHSQVLGLSHPPGQIQGGYTGGPGSTSSSNGAGARSPNILPTPLSAQHPSSIGTSQVGQAMSQGLAQAANEPRSDGAPSTDSKALLALAEEEDEPWPLPGPGTGTGASPGMGGATNGEFEQHPSFGSRASFSSRTGPGPGPGQGVGAGAGLGQDPTSPTLSHSSMSYGPGPGFALGQGVGGEPINGYSRSLGVGGGGPALTGMQAGSPPGSEVLSDHSGHSLALSHSHSHAQHPLSPQARYGLLSPGGSGLGGGGGGSLSGLTSPVGGVSAGSAGQVGSGNPADQNPPINTLYVGNLPAISPPTHPPNFLEESLRSLFARAPGFKRMSFRQKINGPMCFVEFEDVAFATEAMRGLYGHNLGGLVKGGIRLSYSKNSLGQRGVSHANSAHPSLYGGLAHTVALAGMTSSMPGSAAPPNPNPNLNLVGGMYHQVHPNAVRDPASHYPASDRRPDSSMHDHPHAQAHAQGQGLPHGLSANAQPFASSLSLSLSPRQSQSHRTLQSQGAEYPSALSPDQHHSQHHNQHQHPSYQQQHPNQQQAQRDVPSRSGLSSPPLSPTSPIRTPASYAWVSAGQGLGNGYGGYAGFAVGGIGGPGEGLGASVGRSEGSLSGAAAAWGAERGQ